MRPPRVLVPLLLALALAACGRPTPASPSAGGSPGTYEVRMEARCAEGDAHACLVAGLILVGTGPARAHLAFTRGCTLGNLPACTGKAYGIENALGAAGVPGLANRQYEQLCDAGEGTACHNLGVTLMDQGLEGEGRALVERGDKDRRARCAQGDPYYCWDLATSSANEDEVAVRDGQLDKACSAGFELACRDLGRLRVKEEATRAAGLALLERTCERGLGSACAWRGNHDEGTGKLELAMPWFERACARDDGYGCYSLCFAAVTGQGAPKDPARALPSCVRGCELGSSGACDVLGLEVERLGHGRSVDLVVAAQLYKTGCYDDDVTPSACLHLGNMYAAGAGVREDRAAALEAYTRGCEGGVEAACAKGKALAGGGTGGGDDDTEGSEGGAPGEAGSSGP